MSQRPGSSAAIALYQSSDIASWTAAISRYDEAVVFKASVKPKTTTKDLCKLDVWWRTNLPELIATQGHITADQLVSAVDWKLKRGKFRPLMGKVQSNLDAKVRKVTASGFAMVKQGAKSRPPVKDVLAAFTTDLCGVGPATASALLAAADPSAYPFMADEAVEGCGLQRDYTPQRYEEFSARLIAKARSLASTAASQQKSTAQKGSKSTPLVWTAELVGRALWTQATLAAHDKLSPTTSKSAASQEPAAAAKKQKASRLDAEDEAPTQPTDQPKKKQARRR